MEIRKRTTKGVAKRHDLNYFKKGSPVRHWQWRITIVALVAAIVWLAAVSFTHGRELLSKGRISSSHAVFGTQCEACHVPMQRGLLQSVGFRKHVPDDACRTCHVVPDHVSVSLTAATPTPACGTCHVEHAGSMAIARTADSTCTTCHSDLKLKSGSAPHYATAIYSFVKGHPDFAPLRAGYSDPENFKFNHAAHLKAGLFGPGGANSKDRVTLTCNDCHRTAAKANLTPWRFPGAHLQTTAFEPGASSTPLDSAEKEKADTGEPLHTDIGQSLMAPAAYATTCQACHNLKFDKLITEEAPHADPQVVRAFIRSRLRTFAEEHPAEVAADIRNWRPDGGDTFPGYRLYPAPRNTAEWITVRGMQDERRIVHQSCNLCHVMQIPDDSPAPRSLMANFVTDTKPQIASSQDPALPTVEPSRIPTRWLSNAIFSHQAHSAESCESCHVNARNSVEAKDILIPNMASCQTCHSGKSSPQGPPVASGSAESGCFLCHNYHDYRHPQALPDTLKPRDLHLRQLSMLNAQPLSP